MQHRSSCSIPVTLLNRKSECHDHDTKTFAPTSDPTGIQPETQTGTSLPAARGHCEIVPEPQSGADALHAEPGKNVAQEAVEMIESPADASDSGRDPFRPAGNANGEFFPVSSR